MNDTVAILTNYQGDGMGEGRAIMRDTSGNWYHLYEKYSFAGGDRFNSDLLIFPTVIKEFSVVASAQEYDVCSGDVVHLNADVFACSANTYLEWSGIGITGDPFNENTTATIPANATSAITYTVTVIDTSFNDTIIKNVTLLPRNINVDAGADVIIGCDTTGDLQALVSGVTGAGTNLIWSNGVTTPQNNNLGIGTYTVTVSNSYGCTDSDTVKVRYNTDQEVDFTLGTLMYFCYMCNNPDTVFVGNGTATCTEYKTVFLNQSTRTGGWNWKWELGDPDSTYLFTPNGEFNYPIPGNIEVKLIADSSTCLIVKSKPYQLIQAGSNGPCIYYDVFPPGINSVTAPAQPISIYPNPNTGSFSIDASGLTGNTAQVKLLNLLGEEIYQKEHAILPNNSMLEINMRHSLPGLYLLYIEADGQHYAQKVQVE